MHESSNPIRSEWFLWSVLCAGVALTLFVSNREDLWGPGCYSSPTKICWSHEADIVVGGSSRVQFGVAPEEFQTAFPGRRVRNFGFDMVIFTPGYLDAVEAVLDPASEAPIIVLAVEPTVFLRSHADHNIFANLSRRDPQEVLRLAENRWWNRLRDRGAWGAMSVDPWLRNLPGLGGLPRNAWSSGQPDFCTADGWAAQDRAEVDLDAWVPFLHRELEEPLDTEMFDGFLQRITAWEARGVEVWVTRMPASASARTAEEGAKGAPFAELPSLVNATGATWIELDASQYHTYDGSHLRRSEARRYSRDLASSIRVGGSP